MRVTFGLWALLAALAVPHLASADARVIVVRREAGALTDAPAQARLGTPVELTVVLVDDAGLHADSPTRIEGRVRRPLSPLPRGAAVRWLRVEPRLLHTTLPSPNPGIPSFSNAVLTGPRHGDWLGYDTLEYDTVPLEADASVQIEGSTVRLAAAHPSLAASDRHGGAGSIWIAALVTLPDGRVLASADGRSIDRFGLTRDVMRVSFRTGDDYLGWLSTYFNVPNVFGSSGGRGDHQTDRYVGADCADVLVGGRRAMGERFAYASVAGIGTYATPVTEPFTQSADGRESVVLRWGTDVMPGDLVTIDYDNPGDDAILPRAWDHIGTLVADADGDGLLGGADLLRHMSTLGLDDEPLASHGQVRLRVHRWRAPPRSRHAR